jgi:hypothetical protein
VIPKVCRVTQNQLRRVLGALDPLIISLLVLSQLGVRNRFWRHREKIRQPLQKDIKEPTRNYSLADEKKL